MALIRRFAPAALALVLAAPPASAETRIRAAGNAVVVLDELGRLSLCGVPPNGPGCRTVEQLPLRGPRGEAIGYEFDFSTDAESGGRTLHIVSTQRRYIACVMNNTVFQLFCSPAIPLP